MKYQVDIASIGNDQANTLRAFRTVGKISLEHARNIYWFAQHMSRVTLVAGVEKEVAEHVSATLQGSGICCEIVQSSIRTPMICDPKANMPYRWGRLRLVSTPKDVQEGYRPD